MSNLARYAQTFLVFVLVAGNTGCTKRMKAARLLSRANKDYKAERYDRAEIEYRNVLSLAPQTPAAVNRLGLTCYAEGKLTQAFFYLRNAAELDSGNNEVQLRLGQTCLSLQQVKDARAAATLVLQRQPTNEEALMLLADSALTTNDLRETWQRVETLPQAAKGTAAYHVARGTLYARLQDLDKAEGEFKQALAQDSKSSAAYTALGGLYLLRNELKQADSALKAAADLAPLRSARRLRYAEFKLRTGAAEDARKVAEEITEKAPDYVPAWIFLAEMAFGVRKTAECIALLQRVEARDPVNYDALMLHGRISLVEGDATNAITQFERVANLYGRGPRVLYQFALAYLLSQDTTKAIASLNQAIGAAPNFAEAILLLAELNTGRGNPTAAIASLTRLIQQQPRLAQAQLGLAKAYLAQGSPDDAVAVLRRMMELFPKNHEVPCLVGIILMRENKKADARQAFEKSLALSPDYLLAFEQLVDLDLQEKQYAAATQRVRERINRYPAAAEPWVLLARIHLAQAQGYVAKELGKNPGRTQANVKLDQVPAAQPEVIEAEVALRKAIELNPNLRIAYLMLAEMYVATSKQPQALAELNGLLAKTNDVPALMLLGMIHEAAKEYPAAREAYEKLLTVNPNFSPALNNLAYLYSTRLGQDEQAYTLAEKAWRLQPGDPSVEDTLGWILYRRGEYIRSLGLLQDSASKLDDPEIQFHLGMAHYMMGDEDAARLALEKAAHANKDFPGKVEAGRRLSVLAIEPESAGAAVLADLDQWLHKTPNDPVALSRLGAIQERNGAFDQAAQTYQAALKQSTNNAVVMVRLARLWADRLKDPKRALDLMKGAHTLAPDDARVSHLLGRLVFQIGDYQWASSLLEESARGLPNDPEELYDLAWSRYSFGRVAEAEATMTAAGKAGAAFTRNEQAKRFLDLVAAAQSPALAQGAAAHAEQVLATEPDYVPALMVLALTQEQRRNFKEAGRLYDRILARFPQFAPAARNLAILCFEQIGDDQKAYTLAAKARETLPEDGRLARALGILAYRRGDYAQSIRFLEEARRKVLTDAEIVFYLGMAHYQLKEPVLSKEALRQALALNVQPKLADEAKRVLQQLR